MPYEVAIASLNSIAKLRAFLFPDMPEGKIPARCPLLNPRNHLLQGWQELWEPFQLFPGERHRGSLGGRSLCMQRNLVIDQNSYWRNLPAGVRDLSSVWDVLLSIYGRICTILLKTPRSFLWISATNTRYKLEIHLLFVCLFLFCLQKRHQL